MPKKIKTYLVHILLFVLTLLTTTIAGTEHSVNPFVAMDFDNGIQWNYTWQDLQKGLWFSIPFLLVLTVHEFGHYFGLYHTFDTSFGIELANGSNCKTSGDLICDTPADPYSIASVTMDASCNLNPPTKDSNGEYYTPDGCNIMSYYNSPCNSFKFTTGQFNRMIEVMEKGRNYLW